MLSLKDATPVFDLKLTSPPTYPLRPVNTNNTSPLRFTAAAGTKLAGALYLQIFNYTIIVN